MKKQNGKILIPETAIEANKLIQEIGEFQVREQNIKQEANEETKRIKNRASRRLAPGEKAVKRRFRGLYIYYQTHRDELVLDAKTRMLNFIAGQIGLRKSGPAVNINIKKEKAIEELKKRGLEQLIRRIAEVNKEAILENPKLISDIKGITISQKENFIVKTVEAEEAISENIKKLKKFLP